MQASDQGGEAL